MKLLKSPISYPEMLNELQQCFNVIFCSVFWFFLETFLDCISYRLKIVPKVTHIKFYRLQFYRIQLISKQDNFYVFLTHTTFKSNEILRRKLNLFNSRFNDQFIEFWWRKLVASVQCPLIVFIPLESKLQLIYTERVSNILIISASMVSINSLD